MEVVVEAVFDLSNRLCNLPDIAVSRQGHKSRIDTVAGRGQGRRVRDGRTLVACVDGAACVDSTTSIDRAASVHGINRCLAASLARKGAGVVPLGQRQR